MTPAERLREVVALCGFTRIDGPDSGVLSDIAGGFPYAPISRTKVGWVPAAEVRGEGIFVRLDEQTMRDWETTVGGGEQLESLRSAHQEWRRRRGLTDVNLGWPGERYVLLHSLSHALVNELALECGYSVASIRERIYARESEDIKSAMAGVLLYTSAPDSEGTLGGLVALADPNEFARILDAALNRARLCSSDPFCSGHRPDATDPVLHAAAVIRASSSLRRAASVATATSTATHLLRPSLKSAPNSRSCHDGAGERVRPTPYETPLCRFPPARFASWLRLSLATRPPDPTPVRRRRLLFRRLRFVHTPGTCSMLGR